jgi:hypothetical protein
MKNALYIFHILFLTTISAICGAFSISNPILGLVDWVCFIGAMLIIGIIPDKYLHFKLFMFIIVLWIIIFSVTSYLIK